MEFLTMIEVICNIHSSFMASKVIFATAFEVMVWINYRQEDIYTHIRIYIYVCMY